MAITLTDATRTASIRKIASLADVSSPGNLKITSVPGNYGVGTGLLVTCALNATAFSPGAAGVENMGVSPAVSGVAIAQGPPVEFQIEDGAGLAVLKGTVGTSGSGANLIHSTGNITTGGTVTINSLALTAPAV